jgi:protein O-mannosyl-transferase
MSTATETADVLTLESESLSERLCRTYGWLVIAVATTIAYSNTFMAPFVFDGTNYIVDNAELRDLSQPNRILRFSPTRAVGYYTFALNYALSKNLSATEDGYDPRSWHAVNLSIHILAAWTLWGLARRGLQSPRLGGRYADASERLALVMALVWAVHPLCTQAVTYLYQRVESLMGLFLLLTIYCMTRFAACQQRWEEAEFRRPDDWEPAAESDGGPDAPPQFIPGLFLWPLLAVLFCLAGMVTKETMLVAPIVAVWYDRVFLARSWDELFVRRGAYYLALFATLSLLLPLMKMTPYDAAGINDHRHDTPLTYFLNETRVILHYFRLVFIPEGQNLDYSWVRAVVMPDSFRPEGDGDKEAQRKYLIDTFLATKYSLAALSTLGLATLWAVYFRPAIGFLGAAVFVALAPTSSFVVIVDLCFEHRMYVPLMAMAPLVVVLAYEAIGGVRRLEGFCAELGRLVFRLGMFLGRLFAPIRFLGRPVRRLGKLVCRSGRLFNWHDETISTVRISLAWLTVAVLIALTLRRNSDYESHISIWRDAFEKAPHNARAAYNHGVFLQNDTAEGSLDKALEQYYVTLLLKPDYDGAHLNLANVFGWKATFELDFDKRAKFLADAERHYRELLRILPGDERGLYGLADVLRQARRWQEAEEFVDQLLSINPQHEPGQRLKADIARERAKASAIPTPTGDG